MRKNKLITLILLLAISGSSAQPVADIFQLGFQKITVSPFIPINDSVEADVRTIFTMLQLPVRWKRNQMLVIMPFFDQKNISLEKPELLSNQVANNHQASRYNLQSYGFIASNRTTFRDSLKRLFIATGLRYSSETGTRPENARMIPSVAAFFEKRFNKDLALRLGLAYSREYFGDLWMPLIGFDWRANKRLWCWGLLPRSATIDYAISDFWHSCIVYKGLNESYALNENENRYGKDWLHLREGLLRLSQEFYIPGTSLMLSVEAGHTLARTFLFNNRNSNENDVQIPAGNGLIMKCGIYWRVVTDPRFKGGLKNQ